MSAKRKKKPKVFSREEILLKRQKNKLYIEKKFQPGMTWENCNLWRLDHIKPLCRFDLLDQDQAASACHFSNLQPLWAIDNMINGSKYVKSDLEAPSQGVFGIDFSQNLRQIYDFIVRP